MSHSYQISAEAWSWFAAQYQLSDDQCALFKLYGDCLALASTNITALSDPYDILYYHFADSLEAASAVDLIGSKGIVDIGSGGGFPGIPLAIKYPGLSCLLLEVVGKKRQFLDQVIKALGLSNVIVDGRDWRTFLHTSEYRADTLCARASLAPAELVRMFSAGSRYCTARLIYWAAAHWEPSSAEQRYYETVYQYRVGTKNRKLVLFHDMRRG